MAARPILIDCDPGQDDAVMLLLAFASPGELEILGVTTVAGNVPLALTERNARLMCELGGRADVKVFAGCSRPLVRALVTAEDVHGRTGIDGFDIYDPAHPLQAQHAVDFIVETLMAAADDSITFVPTGPLTNIAAALVKEPRIAPKIQEIVLMGGAMREGGNVTPSAEFNIYVDPHARTRRCRHGRVRKRSAPWETRQGGPCNQRSNSTTGMMSRNTRPTAARCTIPAPSPTCCAPICSPASRSTSKSKSIRN